MPNPDPFRLVLPFDQPTTDDQHAANWRTVKDWDTRLLPTGYTRINATKIVIAQPSLTISTIPQVYTHLHLVIHANTSVVGSNNAGLQFNGDTGANYFWNLVSSTTGGAPAANAGVAVNNAVVGQITGTTGAPGTIQVTISNYTAGSPQGVSQCAAYDAGGNFISSGGFLWNFAAAVTSVTFVQASGGNFKAGSWFYIYGEY